MFDANQLRFLVVLESLLGAAALFLFLKFDLRIDKVMTRDTYWRSPAIARLTSYIILAVKYLLYSAFWGFIIAAAWTFLAERFGWPKLPGLDLSLVKTWKFGQSAGYWYVAAAVMVVYFINDIRRCLVSPIWDTFISYKSEDVALARAVADHLISLGKCVWFAEYQVLLQNYALFQQAIDYGLRNSGSAIVFSNNRYANSQYCRHEITELLKRLPPEKIYEIMVPRQELPHSYFQPLAKSPYYEGNDLAGILEFVHKVIGLPGKPALPGKHSGLSARHWTECLGRPFSLDTGDWSVDKEGDIDQYGNIGGLSLRYQGQGDQPLGLFVNLICGREHSYQGQRSSQGSDDRQMYKALFTDAEKHIGDLGVKLTGLHLFYHSGLSQMALTYPVSGGFARNPAQ